MDGLKLETTSPTSSQVDAASNRRQPPMAAVAPLNRDLEWRLAVALRYFADAERIFASASSDDDGAARSLLNDLRYLQDRFADRLRVEREARK